MDTETLIELVQAVSESELTRFRYEEKDVKIQLEKKKGKLQLVKTSELPAEKDSGTAEKKEEKSQSQVKAGRLVESPLVGTFYAAPAEGEKPFVSVGDTVKKGQPLAIIEAMKLMNEIESEYDGTLEEILVENGDMVEYGQPLFRIR